MTKLSTVMLALVLTPTLLAQQPTSEPTSKGDSMHPRYKIETSLGDIVLELDAEKAPITVLNFHQYAMSGFYNGTIFHRVKPEFMIQGGGFISDAEKKTDGLLPPIKNEWKNGLKNVTGSIAMARSGGRPDSATSQFFINVVDNFRLDQPQQDGAAYAVFGKVVLGADAVDAIKNLETRPNPRMRNENSLPLDPPVIKSVTLVTEFDPSKVKATMKKVEEAAAAKREKIAQEIEESVVKASTTDSGLMYVILKEGTGPVPQPTDRVEVHYTGWLRDGTKFDSSRDPKPKFPDGKPFTFSLTGGVIQGWLEGVALMKVGEKRRLIIPSDLAYGTRGRSGIPPDAMLTFDIELLAIK